MADDIKELQQHWYSKLRQEGFKDIEANPDCYRCESLSSRPSMKLINTLPDQKDAIFSYYQQARDLCHTYPFPTDLHRKIWEMHSEGLSKRKIAYEIAQMPDAPRRETIGVIIQTIAKTIKTS